MLARLRFALLTTLALAAALMTVHRASAQDRYSPYQPPRDSRGPYAQQQRNPYERVAQQPDPRQRQPDPRQRQPDPRQQPAQGGNRRPVGARPIAPRAPFTLTPDHARFLDRVLAHWEKESATFKTFQCKFIRYEYDLVWGPRDPNQAMTESVGQLKYAKPDKALFQVMEIRHYTPPQRPGEKPTYKVKQGEFGEHWVCDSTSIWQYNFKKRQLIEHSLPPELRGAAIANGPLPFLFGAKAADMKARYWMRIVTPRDVTDQIWIEAFPKHRQDRANYERVEFIVGVKKESHLGKIRERLIPLGLQVHLPNKKKRTVYGFYDLVINDKLDFLKRDFAKPKLPRGWQKIVEPAPVARRPAARNNRLPPANQGFPPANRERNRR